MFIKFNFQNIIFEALITDFSSTYAPLGLVRIDSGECLLNECTGAC